MPLCWESAWACRGHILAMKILLEHCCQQHSTMLKTLVLTSKKLLLILSNMNLAGQELSGFFTLWSCNSWAHSYMLPAPGGQFMSENIFFKGEFKARMDRNISLWDSQFIISHCWKHGRVFLCGQWENVFVWFGAPGPHLIHSLLLYIVCFSCVKHDLNFLPNQVQKSIFCSFRSSDHCSMCPWWLCWFFFLFFQYFWLHFKLSQQILCY